MYLGSPVEPIFVEIEGGVDEGRCVVQFHVGEFHGTAWMRRFSDKRDERMVVYPYWRFGQGVKSMVLNRILALVVLGNQ